jgi:hypothetical protein
MYYLKNTTGRFFLLAFLLALGCSKDDPQPSLIGTWKEGRTFAGGCADALNNGNSTCATSCSAVITAKTITWPSISSAALNYTLSGKTLAIQGTGASITFTYELTAGALTLAFKEVSDGCTYTVYFSK